MIYIFIIFLIFFLLYFLKKNNYEPFQTHEMILREIIKNKVSPENLSKIPILNNIDPTIEIKKQMNSFKEINEKEEVKKEKDVNIKSKNNIVINKSISENSCKYISSYNSSPSCPANYNIYSGASMGISDGTLSCNDTTISNESAKGHAIIEDGSIKKINITHSGSNYYKKPSIFIIGDGKLATAEAVIKNGKVIKVIITNPGKKYSYSPKIEFSKPDGMIYCHLCCKDLNQII